MTFSLKTKIWLTVITIVIMFSFFTLYYFPSKQEALFRKNYNTEIQNLANTVALGVNIAGDEENFEGVRTAMEFVKEDPRLKFVSLIQHDSLSKQKTVFITFPTDFPVQPTMNTNKDIIIKRAVINCQSLKGEVMIGFTTKEIRDNTASIIRTALLVSGFVLVISVLIGFWLAKRITDPLRKLQLTAEAIGKGNLDQRIEKLTKDEVGELGKTFNRMIEDLVSTRDALNASKDHLQKTNDELNKTLHDLKDAQTQLIQSEKMASLGELTAGIAHEIQNPLNFVNNFSEVSAELLEEMKEELEKQNIDDAKAIADDLILNLQKINHHGKRADGIVKGMLQHSRSNTGIQEPVDLNALVDEYMRLTYHGLRAKDKTFNANFKGNFDDTIGMVTLNHQEIGRVVLNILTNAFYAVNERRISMQANGEKYDPMVLITTRKLNNKVEISIEDNGGGIPASIREKIFQPFFTTKPTGKGTGLGLSLSYDIITKGHHGELKLESEEGKGTRFEIILPI
ncbi:MAG: HAMP domain-containing protein [Chitinophagaceae bacterium]|nr:HAMP domain-containing protein [Chitinophagaceae bacterium]